MRVLKGTAGNVHASFCLLDTERLRRTNPEKFATFGLVLELRALQSRTALRNAECLWAFRASRLSSMVASSRAASEAQARHDLANLIEGLHERRAAFEAYVAKIEAIQAADAAEDQLAKNILLGELKGNATAARARRLARKMKNTAEELALIRQRETLPRHVNA